MLFFSSNAITILSNRTLAVHKTPGATLLRADHLIFEEKEKGGRIGKDWEGLGIKEAGLEHSVHARRYFFPKECRVIVLSNFGFFSLSTLFAGFVSSQLYDARLSFFHLEL